MIETYIIIIVERFIVLSIIIIVIVIIILIITYLYTHTRVLECLYISFVNKINKKKVNQRLYCVS
jgi:hypothetical protein